MFWAVAGVMVPASVILAAAQPAVDALVAAVKPALPFPAASADGELPADNGAESRWFVVWPAASGESRVLVKANPLNPEVQKAGAEAMAQINKAIAAAERRAQAAYDKALEEVRRTGKSSNIDGVTLDDEGVAGERIDAELQLVIELHPAESFELASAEAPVIRAGTDGPSWVISVPAHTYTVETMAGSRERFQAAETWLLFGGVPQPVVSSRIEDAVHQVNVAPVDGAFSVVLRGSSRLVPQVVSGADWAALVPR